MNEAEKDAYYRRRVNEIRAPLRFRLLMVVAVSVGAWFLLFLFGFWIYKAFTG